MDESDAAAVARACAGETEAFRVLVDRYSRKVFRLAYRMTCNEEDAEDVVQETFLRAYRRLKQFELRSSFGTWIYRIAVRCALDRINSSKVEGTSRIAPETDPVQREMQLPNETAGPERLLLSREIGKMQETAMHSLTPIERTAFVLRHMEDLTTEEIASALGIAPNAAKQAVFRAVQKLRCRLAALRVNI